VTPWASTVGGVRRGQLRTGAPRHLGTNGQVALMYWVGSGADPAERTPARRYERCTSGSFTVWSSALVVVRVGTGTATR
jgi:hypothetical protein